MRSTKSKEAEKCNILEQKSDFQLHRQERRLEFEKVGKCGTSDDGQLIFPVINVRLDYCDYELKTSLSLSDCKSVKIL